MRHRTNPSRRNRRRAQLAIVRAELEFQTWLAQAWHEDAEFYRWLTAGGWPPPRTRSENVKLEGS